MDYRLFFPATQRNKKYIGDVLSRLILKKGFILEIGSGSGEHGIEFQKRFPEIIWQTSDPYLEHRKSISSWIAYENLNNKMPEPIEIDVNKRPWKIPSMLSESLQGIISINMIHIAPWSCTKSSEFILTILNIVFSSLLTKTPTLLMFFVSHFIGLIIFRFENS